ncbi:unnamed protein product [Cylindrotheca closterium]|uniref:Uncharacterized protein n=1 Tax=Cylindrotheca closterium TaxID=2856 RepID=A0AAD2G2U6_9STRA|nr:unnamed protein product [Cylindrotheca closterium]
MIVNSSQDLCFPSASSKLPSKTNKMELSQACKKEGGVPSLISMMVLRERCSGEPQTREETSKSNELDTSALLAVLDGIDLLDMSFTSQHSRFDDSSRVNSKVPLRKPERRLSWESLTGDEQSTSVHESSSNAVFDVITSEQSPVRRGSNLLHRLSTSSQGDTALCKPTRKSSGDNLFALHKRRQPRHSLGSFLSAR